VNIVETDRAFTVQVVAPGLEKQKISMTTQNDMLSIRYKAEANCENSKSLLGWNTWSKKLSVRLT
jgi:HSP20 family molecular chaperone IbpA